MAAHTVEIVVRGRLGPTLIAALDGFAIEDERGVTRMTGVVSDQAKLFGILAMFDGLHVEVVSVNRVDEVSSEQGDAPLHSGF